MLLREDPIVRLCAPSASFIAEALSEVTQANDAAAGFGLRWSNLLMPHTLFDANGGSVQVHVFPLQTERLGDTHTGGDAQFNDEAFFRIHPSEDTRSFFEGEDSALGRVPFAAEFCLARRAAAPLFPEPVALSIVVELAQRGADRVHGPPGIKGGMEPVLDGLRAQLVKPECAPLGDNVAIQKVPLFLARRLCELLLAAQVALLVHAGDFADQCDAGGGDLFDSGFDGWRVQRGEELVPFDLGFLFGDLLVAAAETHR